MREGVYAGGYMREGVYAGGCVCGRVYAGGCMRDGESGCNMSLQRLSKVVQYNFSSPSPLPLLPSSPPHTHLYTSHSGRQYQARVVAMYHGHYSNGTSREAPRVLVRIFVLSLLCVCEGVGGCVRVCEGV